MKNKLIDIGIPKKWNFIFLLFSLLFIPPSLFAVDLVVSGVADPYADANGIYTLQSETTWKHSGSSTTYYIYKYFDADFQAYYWIFDTNKTKEDGFIAGSNDAATSTSPAGVAMDNSMTIAEYSTTPEINLTGNGVSITSGATTPTYTDYTNFGTAVTGGGTATRTFTIQNTGASALSVGPISFSGTNKSDFSVTTLPASSVAALGSITFVVTFTPSAVGIRTATISIVNGDSNENPYTFAISGYGFITKDLIVSGTTTPSANGTYKYAGIKNDFPYWKHSTLNYYLISYPATTIGVDPTWALDNNFLTTDGYSFYCYSAANVPTGLLWSTSSFLPTGSSSYIQGEGTLSVTDVTTAPEINIKGGSFDIASGSSVIDFYHHTNFGTLNIASGTKSQSFTIENKGTGTLTLTGASPYVTLTDNTNFSITTVPAASIAAGGSTTFTVTFDPSTVGTKTAVVNILNNDGDEGSYSFNIQGEAITPKSIIVSNITTPAAANGTYTYQNISNDFECWKNSSGYYIYNYRQSNTDDSYDPIWYIDANNSVTPSDATTYNFSATSSNGSIVSPTNISSWTASTGNTGTPTIVFSEPEINIVGNSLNILSGDNTPSEYDYTDLGWVASGSVSKTFTIQNLGTETLTLTGTSPYITIGGTNPTNFSIVSAPAASITAGGSTTFQVTCTPSASLGTYSAILSIANNDANENPYTFSIQGGKGTLPSATSQAVSSIGTITATGNGTITGLGSPNPIDYGICWNTTGTPTISDNISSKGATSTASSFTANMTGLTPNITYHARAYVTNKVGTVYGTEQTFTTLLPTITSATYSASTGILALTCTNISSGDVINPSKITITGEGGETYTLTTGNVNASSSTAASITLNTTDKAAINLILNKNGTSSTSGTTYNLAAADDWDANITAGDISDLTGNGTTVSNVAVPAITSATYDANTGTLVVTGTGFLKLSGATNDITVSKLTITGESGTTYTLTTSNVDITSGTSFSVVLNASDKAAVNPIVNKNGTSSTGGTTYNLAAAEDWAVGADASVIVADLTGNGITVSNVAVPAITSATYDANTGTLVVTGAGLLKLSGSNNDINVSKLTITGESGATYTLTTSNVDITSGTSFSVVLNATDKATVNTIVNKNGTSSTGGTTYNMTAAEDWDTGADASVTVADLTGNSITASNLATPTVTTQAVSSITLATATGNGTIISLGTSNPTQYGVVWGTSLNPDISLTTKTAQGTTSTTGAITSSITGLAAGITYHVRAYATNATGTSYGDDVSFTTLTAGTWTGATDTDWSKDSNWAGGIAPTASTDVIIPFGLSTYPQIIATKTADCKNLTLNGSLTISNTGSLIVHGTVSGTGSTTAELYLTANKWHIISPIASGQSVASFLTANANIPTKTGSPDRRGMMDYNTADNKWNDYYPVSDASGTMDAAKGYSARVSTDGVITFNGNITSGNYTKTGLITTGEGWNCIGNPYTSAIGITTDAVSTDNFLKTNATAGSSNLDPAYACLYLWDQTNNRYDIINNTGTSGRYLAQDYIAPGQGFFVKAATNGAQVTFTRDMQSHQNNTNAPLLKSAKISWPVIKLNVTNDKATASTIVAFNSDMTKGLDPTYDAGLLRGTTGVNLYSRLVDDNGIDFAIQCLPEDYNAIIPLGVESKNGGQISFNAETVELPDYCEVSLEDKVTNTITTLSGSTSYNATVDANTKGIGRFYLHLKNSNTTTGLESNANNAITAYSINNVIYIKGNIQQGATAQLFDLMGKQITLYNLQAGSLNSLNTSIPNGVYVIKVNNKNQVVSKKVAILNK